MEERWAPEASEAISPFIYIYIASCIISDSRKPKSVQNNRKYPPNVSLFPHHQKRQEKRGLPDPPTPPQEGSHAGGSTVFTVSRFSKKGCQNDLPKHTFWTPLAPKVLQEHDFSAPLQRRCNPGAPGSAPGGGSTHAGAVVTTLGTPKALCLGIYIYICMECRDY